MTALALLLRYWREAGIALLILGLIVAFSIVRGAYAERDQLRQEKAVLTAQLQGAMAMQAMTNQIAEAISQIKIRSSINVSRIESAPKPKFVDARPLPFIAGGLLQAVYTSASGHRAPSGNETGGPAPASVP